MGTVSINWMNLKAEKQNCKNQYYKKGSDLFKKSGTQPKYHEFSDEYRTASFKVKNQIDAGAHHSGYIDARDACFYKKYKIKEFLVKLSSLLREYDASLFLGGRYSDGEITFRGEVTLDQEDISKHITSLDPNEK